VVVGEDVAFGRDDDARAEAGSALLGAVVEAVAEEVAEQRVVGKGWRWP
jgi:5-carboxymethyl-2-hydroxymuconate isomerase